MLEEQGRVVAVAPGLVWVETLRRSTCNNCLAQSGCGQGLLSRMLSPAHTHVQAASNEDLEVGDQVVLGIPEHSLLQSSLLAYGMPLLCFILFALLADLILGLAEVGVIMAAAAGLVLGFGLLRLYSRSGHAVAYQPRVLRKLAPGSARFWGPTQH